MLDGQNHVGIQLGLNTVGFIKLCRDNQSEGSRIFPEGLEVKPEKV